MPAGIVREQVLCLDDAGEGPFQLFVSDSDIWMLRRLLVLDDLAVPLLVGQVLLHAADVHGMRM